MLARADSTKQLMSTYSTKSGLTHLDVSEYARFKDEDVCASNVYSDVFIHECSLPTRGKTKVAIKRLRFYAKEDIASLFKKEIYAWSKLKHPNILPLLGFSADERTKYPSLVTEWMENGSSWDYVHTHPECDVLRLLSGIAEGLAYLHVRDIIHSDIKPDNILVSESGDALIADFGCARMVDASISLADMGGVTKRYLAYELLSAENISAGYTKESDVWAFGMTVYELLTLRRSYEGYEERQVPLAIVRDGKLPSFPTPCPWRSLGIEVQDTLRDICQSCWARDPSARPSMQTILHKLLALRGMQNMAVTQKEKGMSDLYSVTATAYALPSGETVTYHPTPTATRSSTVVEVPTCIPWGRTRARLRAMFSRVRRVKRREFANP